MSVCRSEVYLQSMLVCQCVRWGVSLEYVGVSVCQSEVYLYLQSMLDVGVSEF